jgi:hypothetical protein
MRARRFFWGRSSGVAGVQELQKEEAAWAKQKVNPSRFRFSILHLLNSFPPSFLQKMKNDFGKFGADAVDFAYLRHRRLPETFHGTEPL